jgi:multiple sugar transport system substrate-binding protein
MIEKRAVIFYVGLFLAIIITPLAFTAGQEGAEPEQKAVASLDFWTGGYPAPGIQVINDKIAEFEKTNPHIRVGYSPIPWAQYRAKLKNAFTIGPAPDMFIDSFQQRWNDLGALEPTKKYLDNFADKDLLDPAAYEKLNLDGVLVGIPYQVYVWTVLYHPDIFEERGVDPNIGILTLDKLLELAKEMTWDSTGDGTIDYYGIGLLGGRLSSQFLNVAFYNKGGTFVNENGEFILDDYKEQYIESLDYLLSLAEYTPGGPQAAAARTYTQLRPLFAKQRVVMTTDVPLINQKEVESLNPSVASNLRSFVIERGMTSHDHLYIVKSSKHKQEVWEFMQYLLSKDVNVPVNLAIGSMPARTDVADHPMIQENPLLVDSVAQLTVTTGNGPHVGNVFRGYDEIRPYIFDAVAAAFLGEQTSTEAIEEMLENMHRELGS